MPSFYSAADQARRLALTPPEYHTGYPTLTAGDARLGGHPPYANHGHYLAYLEKDVPDYTDRFGRPPAYGPTATNTYHNQHQYQSQSQQPPLKATATASNASTAAHDAYYASRYGHRQRSYGPVAAPVLPSLRPNEPTAAAAAAAAAASRDHVRQSYPSLPEPTRTEPPKDDKPVGGVAAVLDYEMDQMAAFVAETAQRMYVTSLPAPCLRRRRRRRR